MKNCLLPFLFLVTSIVCSQDPNTSTYKKRALETAEIDLLFSYYGQDGGAAIMGAITNPFAWAQFFDALKRGDFKSKK